MSSRSASGHQPADAAANIHTGATRAIARSHNGRAQVPTAYRAASVGSDWKMLASWPLISHSGYAAPNVITAASGFRCSASNGSVLSASSATSVRPIGCPNPSASKTDATNTAVSTTVTASARPAESIIASTTLLPAAEVAGPIRNRELAAVLYVDRRISTRSASYV